MPDLKSSESEQENDKPKSETPTNSEPPVHVQVTNPKVPKLKEQKPLVIPARFITILSASYTYRVSIKRIQKAIRNNEVEALVVGRFEYVNKKHVLRLKRRIMKLVYYSIIAVCILIVLVLPFLLQLFM